ncbi:MAG: hypothetical protein ACE5GA_04230 [Candidatus Zixiibacteriota bacterium]
MADGNSEDSSRKKPQLSITDNERLRYIGFDVGPSEIGALFKTKVEEQRFVDHVIDKRQHDDVFRDTSNFREERISQGERYVVLAASLAVILSFFLPFTPWVSGHIQTESEVTASATTGAADATPVTPADPVAPSTADPAGAGTEDPEEDADPASDDAAADGDGSETDNGATTGSATSRTGGGVVGFQELQVGKKKTRIVKTPYSLSGLGVIIGIGNYGPKIFSSGVALILSGVLFLAYILMSLVIPGYIAWSVWSIRGDPDEVALKLKKTLRLAWIPALVWVAMIALSVIGADYGFDTSGALEQVGESYNIMSLLGLLGLGFYITLAGFFIAGAKSVEI